MDKPSMCVVACGDALFSSRNLAKRLDSELRDILGGADAVFANAEFCCPQRDTPPMPRRFVTAVAPEILDELSSLNIRMLSFANNHAGDFGPRGVVDTLVAANQRSLLPCGIGHDLYEARSARFLDTPVGRIGIVAAGTTRAAEFCASAPGAGVPGRPGINPLRFSRSYVLPDAQFDALREIDEMLGIAKSRREMARVEVLGDPGPDHLKFGSLLESSVDIERGSKPQVKYRVNTDDQNAILANVRDAACRADIVLMSLHTHEGVDDNWYAPHAPPFIEAFARAAIDAGADAVLGHGAHMLRGIEIYRRKPIFYNLGSLFMEFEAGEQRMTPEMYEGYGHSRDALPSELHAGRARDGDGTPIGFYADARFSRGAIAVCDFDSNGVRVKLVPIDLDFNRVRSAQRGVPMHASEELGRVIAGAMQEMSTPYGTSMQYDAAERSISVAIQ